MHFLGFVIFNSVANDFLLHVKRTKNGFIRRYVRAPDNARRFRSIRSAVESVKDSPRFSEMIVLKLFEDDKNFYVVKPDSE